MEAIEAAVFLGMGPTTPHSPFESSHIPGVPSALMELSLAAASCPEETSYLSLVMGGVGWGGAGAQSLHTPPQSVQLGKFTSRGASLQHARRAAPSE